MYNVLLVDDEMPALRLLQAIMEKYAEHFAVAQSCSGGKAALSFLKTHDDIDLLLTDISMPDMDGIQLAKKARELRPNIHIVIISGYAEFEYAKGAIEAAVDDYLLKPVSLSHMKKMLQKVKGKLDEELENLLPGLLTALLTERDCDQAWLRRLYGTERYYFALVRWGNLRIPQSELKTTAPIPLSVANFSALNGRDENEQLLFAKANMPAIDFQSAVKAYMATRQNATSTIVFSRNSNAFSALGDFYSRASRALERKAVIGRHQYVFLSNTAPSLDSPHISSSTIKRLEIFIQDGNTRMIKEIFLSLAVDWEKRQVTQLYVSMMTQQLVHFVLSLGLGQGRQQEFIVRELNDLLRYAVSYGELMAGLYSALFDNNTLRDKRLSPEDLYSFAVRTIQEKYAQPISIQSICADVGISQTYLSRLFRKYGNTSFNTFLVQCRMDNAKAMIREHPKMPLHQVATCVGYDDYAYFSKVFHQSVGCTPSQYAAEDRDR